MAKDVVAREDQGLPTPHVGQVVQFFQHSTPSENKDQASRDAVAAIVVERGGSPGFCTLQLFGKRAAGGVVEYVPHFSDPRCGDPDWAPLRNAGTWRFPPHDVYDIAKSQTSNQADAVSNREKQQRDREEAIRVLQGQRVQSKQTVGTS